MEKVSIKYYMNKKNIFIVILGFIIFVSFAFFNKSNDSKNNNFLSEIKKEKYIIMDNDFINRVEKNDLNYQTVKNIFIYSNEIIKDYKIHQDDDSTKTKLVILNTKNDDEISFIKNQKDFDPFIFHINSDSIVLDKDIKIGVDKYVFEKKFNRKFLPNEINIATNPEGFIYFTFLFKNNKLIKIIYDAETTLIETY